MSLFPINAVTLLQNLRPLSEQEVAACGGYTHMAVLTADMLTQATANTAQDINLNTFLDGAYAQKAEIALITPFQDASDPAFNSTTLTLKDDLTPNTLITAKELNANGTYITEPATSSQAYGPYTAGKHLIAEFGSMTGKKLVDIDVGEVHIFVQLLRPTDLSEATPKAQIDKA